MFSALLTLTTVFGLSRLAHSADLRQIATEELEVIKTDCFAPRHHLKNISRCFDTIDASIVTNKELIKAMALAVAAKDQPSEQPVGEAALQTQTGKDAYLMYLLYLKKVDEFKKLYYTDETYVAHRKMVKNDARLQRLASLFLDDPKSSYSFLLKQQEELKRVPGWNPKLKQTQICKYLKSNEKTKWLYADDIKLVFDPKLNQVLKELRLACVDPAKASTFVSELLDRQFKNAEEVFKFVNARANNPLYKLAFKKALDPFSTAIFHRLRPLVDLVSVITQIKCKSGPDSSAIKLAQAPSSWKRATPTQPEQATAEPVELYPAQMNEDQLNAWLDTLGN